MKQDEQDIMGLINLVHTVNDSLDPARPLGKRVLAEVVRDEDTLDHQPDILDICLRS